MIIHTLHDMIKEKENNTKATIHGDKEGFLVTDTFVDTEPPEPGGRGCPPQKFWQICRPYLHQDGSAGYAPLQDFQAFLRP